MATNWQEIATELKEALDSFMAYDGYGQGGIADTNRGDWPAAEKAQRDYSLMLFPELSDESKRARFNAGVEEVHQQFLSEKRSEWERPT